MPAQIVFLTLFLGLASGKQPVALEVTGPVQVVRLYLDDKEVGAATPPSWRLILDLGPELTPRELLAIGYDASGNELARAKQMLNLPRPTAEFDIVVEKDTALLHWRHLMNVRPTRAKLTLDGKPLAVNDSLQAKLPKLDRDIPHVLSAELQFADGFLARRELVIESVRSDSVGTELTPVLLRQTARQHPPSWDGCLALPGRPVRTAAVEKPPALVILVKDPDPMEVLQPLHLTVRAQTGGNDSLIRKMLTLDRETFVRILWPVAKRYVDSATTSVLFEPSADVPADKVGLLHMLLVGYVGENSNGARQFADATAVAGVRSITGSWRRAVVVVLSASDDMSKHDPRVVRRYLQSIGVPLFVWSVTGPHPELEQAWGKIDDVSSMGKLGRAVGRLRETLAQQRVAWVDVDPLRALHLQAKESCGVAVMAQPAP